MIDFIPRAIFDHEDRRWSYMTDQQLSKRLTKIKRRDKLSAFYQAAYIRGKGRLTDEAIERYNSLFGIKQQVYKKEENTIFDNYAKVFKEKKKWKSKVVVKKVVIEEEFIEVEIPRLTRALDF